MHSATRLEFQPLLSQIPEYVAGGSQLDADQQLIRRVVDPVLSAGTLSGFFHAKLEIFEDEGLLKTLMDWSERKGEEFAKRRKAGEAEPRSSLEMSRVLDRLVTRASFLSPAAKESFRSGIRSFRRYFDLLEKIDRFEFSVGTSDGNIIARAQLTFAWALTVLEGVRPACDEAASEIAKSLDAFMSAGAELFAARAENRDPDRDNIEDLLDAERLRAQQVLAPQDFEPGLSLDELAAANRDLN